MAGVLVACEVAGVMAGKMKNEGLDHNIKAPTLKPKYQIVEDDAASNEGNCPFVMLGRCDLNSEFAKGLKAAFEHPDCVLRAYPDLVIEKHKNTKGTERDLPSTNGSCMSFDRPTAHHQQASEMVQRTISRQDMPSLPIFTH